jgi:hypothetical protein
MKAIQRILNYPITRLILWGNLKALIIAPITSLLLAGYVVIRVYGPAFDLYLRPFGTASDFFFIVSIFTVISSIPVVLLTSVLLAVFLKSDVTKRRNSNKRSFVIGMLIGGIMGCSGTFIIGNSIADFYLYLVIFIFTSFAGGLGGLWMTKDAKRIYPLLPPPSNPSS